MFGMSIFRGLLRLAPSKSRSAGPDGGLHGLRRQLAGPKSFWPCYVPNSGRRARSGCYMAPGAWDCGVNCSEEKIYRVAATPSSSNLERQSRKGLCLLRPSRPDNCRFQWSIDSSFLRARNSGSCPRGKRKEERGRVVFTTKFPIGIAAKTFGRSTKEEGAGREEALGRQFDYTF